MMSEKQSFAELVASNLKSSTERELADEFGVAPSTISRWARGSVVPHPLVVDMVASYFERVDRVQK